MNKLLMATIVAALATTLIPTTATADPNPGCTGVGGATACLTSYSYTSGAGCDGGYTYSYNRVSVYAAGTNTQAGGMNWCAYSYWEEHYLWAYSFTPVGRVGVYHLDSTGPYAYPCVLMVYAGPAGSTNLGCYHLPASPSWGNLLP